MTKHPEVPKNTSYCYDIIGHTELGIKVKTCPHWQSLPNGARCNLLNLESEDGSALNLIWDQVKECGINEAEDEVVD